MTAAVRMASTDLATSVLIRGDLVIRCTRLAVSFGGFVWW
jgi:hypothetical protein